MNKKLYKLLIPILFALAILLGLFQRNNLPDFSFGKKTTIKHFTTPSANSLEGYYAKSQEISKSLEQPLSKTSFLAVGDIMLSRNVAGIMKKSGDNNLPFSKMENILKSTDFNFGNLESPVSANAPIIGGHSLIFGTSKELISGLSNYKFKVLNLANNHALDQGLLGVKTTIKTLNELDIKHVGIGENLNEAWTPAIIENNGMKICFVGASYSSVNDGGQTRNEYVARIDDIKNLKLQITNSKLLCSFIVVTMHAGTEYTRTPNKTQIDFAHTAIEAGADMVIGAHPHWVQTIERYCPHPLLTSPLKGEETAVIPLPRGERGEVACTNPKYIFYSLGNFIFDQEWSQDTKEGLALKIQISNSKSQNELQGPRTPAKLESVELIPVIIENYSTPRPATADEAKKILEKIGEKDTILK